MMSWGLGFNILICLCSLLDAWLEFGETRNAFKNATGAHRKGKLVKLLLLVGIPVLSIICLPFTIMEASVLNREIGELKMDVEDQKPRVVTEAQRRAAPERLSEHAGTRFIISSSYDSEAERFGEMLVELLKESGWISSGGISGYHVTTGNGKTFNPVGVAIEVNNPEFAHAVIALDDFLRECNIRSEIITSPNPGIVFGGGAILIHVGSKN